MLKYFCWILSFSWKQCREIVNKTTLCSVIGQWSRKYAKMLWDFPISWSWQLDYAENSAFPFIALRDSFGTFIEHTPPKHSIEPRDKTRTLLSENTQVLQEFLSQQHTGQKKNRILQQPRSLAVAAKEIAGPQSNKSAAVTINWVSHQAPARQIGLRERVPLHTFMLLFFRYPLAKWSDESDHSKSTTSDIALTC